MPTSDGSHAYVGQGGWTAAGALLFSVAIAERAPGAPAFGAPKPLGAPFNIGGNGGVPQWLSTDECSLYFVAQAPGATYLQLNVARK